MESPASSEPQSKKSSRERIQDNAFLNFLSRFRLRHWGWPVVKVAVEGARRWSKMGSQQRSRFEVKPMSINVDESTSKASITAKGQAKRRGRRVKRKTIGLKVKKSRRRVKKKKGKKSKRKGRGKRRNSKSSNRSGSRSVSGGSPRRGRRRSKRSLRSQ